MTSKTPEELDADNRVLNQKIESFIDGTKDYRVRLCQKLDAINDKMDKMAEKLATLPCGVQFQRMDQQDKRLDNHSGQISKLWAMCGVIILIIVGAYFEHFIKK